MTVRVRGGRFMLDVRHQHSDGRVERIRIAVPSDKQSTRAAEAYERTVLADLRAGVDPRRTQATPEIERTVVPTLATFADEYLQRSETTNRPRFAREKARIVRKRLLPFFGETPLDRIGIRDIELYRTERRKSVTAKTVNDEVAILRHMLNTAAEFEIIAKVPRVRPLKMEQPEAAFLEQGEQDRLLAAARLEDGPWAAMIMTGLRTGLRLGELRGLRWRDVDLVAGRIVVRVAADDRSALHPPKSGKPRDVPLGADVLAVLKAHRHLRVHVFDAEDGSILRDDKCRHAMERIRRRAGLAIGEGAWHLLRHTFASELVMRGATLPAVQQLLGHASLAMVLRYAHLSPDHRRDAVRLLDRGHTLGTPEGEIAKRGG